MTGTPKKVYLDYNATSPIINEIADLYSNGELFFGNPSSIHLHGQKARALLEIARKKIATSICSSSRDGRGGWFACTE